MRSDDVLGLRPHYQARAAEIDARIRLELELDEHRRFVMLANRRLAQWRLGLPPGRCRALHYVLRGYRSYLEIRVLRRRWPRSPVIAKLLLQLNE